MYRSVSDNEDWIRNPTRNRTQKWDYIGKEFKLLDFIEYGKRLYLFCKKKNPYILNPLHIRRYEQFREEIRCLTFNMRNDMLRFSIWILKWKSRAHQREIQSFDLSKLLREKDRYRKLEIEIWPMENASGSIFEGKEVMFPIFEKIQFIWTTV
jgi:hypothetical protein